MELGSGGPLACLLAPAVPWGVGVGVGGGGVGVGEGWGGAVGHCYSSEKPPTLHPPPPPSLLPSSLCAS